MSSKIRGSSRTAPARARRVRWESTTIWSLLIACESLVRLDSISGQAMKASHPLKEARIEVAEIAGKPGAYKAVAFLRPHFQLDELTVSLRLVAELPPSARG